MFFEELFDSSYKKCCSTHPESSSILSYNKGDLCLYEFALRFPRPIDFHKDQEMIRNICIEDIDF